MACGSRLWSRPPAWPLPAKFLPPPSARLARLLAPRAWRAKELAPARVTSIDRRNTFLFGHVIVSWAFLVPFCSAGAYGLRLRPRLAVSEANSRLVYAGFVPPRRIYIYRILTYIKPIPIYGGRYIFFPVNNSKGNPRAPSTFSSAYRDRESCRSHGSSPV